MIEVEQIIANMTETEQMKESNSGNKISVQQQKCFSLNGRGNQAASAELHARANM